MSVLNKTRIKPGEISIGDVLPWPVYDNEEALLLQKETLIRSEKQLSVILEKGLYRGLTEKEVSEKKTQVLKKPDIQPKIINVSQMKNTCVEKIELLMQQLISSEKVDVIESVRFISEQIKMACKQNANAVLAAVHLSKETNYAVLHPLHTAIVCELLMRRLKLSEQQHETVIAAALTMNVGMYALQEELFTQAEPLSAKQQKKIHQHPEESAVILEKNGVNDVHLLDIIRQHHERSDGEGYPRQLKSKQIHQGAKLIALADMYSAMITRRAYRKPILAHTALRDIFTERGKSVDDHLTQLLVREIGIYPPGSFVKLMGGDTAIVIKRAIVKKDRNATAPVVCCLISPRGGLYENPTMRDSNRNLYKIKEFCEPKFEKPIDLMRLWV